MVRPREETHKVLKLICEIHYKQQKGKKKESKIKGTLKEDKNTPQE